MENLFLTNDGLKKEVEQLKEKINCLNIQLNDYEDTITRMLNEAEQIKQSSKNYSKGYFQTKTKNRIVNCKCCNLDIKYSSYCNHLKSKLHLQNVNKEKQEETIEPTETIEI